MIKIRELIWDEWNVNHIKRHNITRGEVEELCKGKYKRQPTYGKRYLILGRIKSGRALTVIFAREKPGRYYVITARDMSKKERKQFL